MRTTKRDMERALDYFCSMSNGRFHKATAWSDVGGLYIERYEGTPRHYVLMRHVLTSYYANNEKIESIGDDYAFYTAAMPAAEFVTMLYHMVELMRRIDNTETQ